MRPSLFLCFPKVPPRRKHRQRMTEPPGHCTLKGMSSSAHLPPSAESVSPAQVSSVDLDSLSGPDLERFFQALLSAFPEQASLARAIAFGMNENLAAIATGNLRDTVFALLRWARSQGRLAELLKATLEANPSNPSLRQFAESVGFLRATQEKAPGQAEAPTQAATARVAGTSHAAQRAEPLDEASLARELRKSLAELYSSPMEATRVAADAGIQTSRVAFSGSAESIWFSVLQEARKSAQIADLLGVALTDYPKHPELKRLAASLSPEGQPESVRPAPDRGANSYALYDELAGLLPAQFEEVLFRLSVPLRFLPPPSTAQSERAIALVRWMEQKNQLQELFSALGRVKAARLPTTAAGATRHWRELYSQQPCPSSLLRKTSPCSQAQ